MSLQTYNDLALLRVIEIFKVEAKPTLTHPEGVTPPPILNQLEAEAERRGLALH